MTLIEQLRRDEGVRHRVYADTLGHATIGIGHNLAEPITDAAIEQIFHDDLAGVTAELSFFPFWPGLSEVRQAVLQNMAFNLGVHGLRNGFGPMLAALEDGDYGLAADRMLGKSWERQVGDRARRLAAQMRTDTWH